MKRPISITDLEYQNLSGHVQGVYNENSGAVSFEIDGHEEVAFFSQKDFFFNGKPVNNIWKNLVRPSICYQFQMSQSPPPPHCSGLQKKCTNHLGTRI